MDAICKYCHEIISDEDMARTDAEKKVLGGGAKFLGYTDPPSALFAHQVCYDASEDAKNEQ